MANPTHLKMLGEGPPGWNRWRSLNPTVIPDLSWTPDLFIPPFRGLGSYDFSRVDFRGTLINDYHLEGSNFQEANFDWAHLMFAHFSRSDLSRASFEWASIVSCNWKGATLAGARFAGTTLANTNLSAVADLDSIVHGGPSFIDFKTVERSGSLPLGFLRGCGLADALINLLPSLPVGFDSCFISYSNHDQPFADRLYRDLQSHGIRCWYATESIRSGRKLYEQIDQAINLHDRLLLVLSEHSMNSEWVKTEIATARTRESKENRRVLFPIGLAPFQTIRKWKYFDADVGKDSAREIREYYIPDFGQWKDNDQYQQAFARLLNDLKRDPSG